MCIRLYVNRMQLQKGAKNYKQHLFVHQLRLQGKVHSIELNMETQNPINAKKENSVSLLFLGKLVSVNDWNLSLSQHRFSLK